MFIRSRLPLGLADCLDEFDEVLLLVAEELELLSASLLLDLLPLAVALLNGLDLGLELDDLVLELGLLSLEFLDFAFQVGLSVLSLQLFSHGEGDRGLIECLVCGDGHLDLVPHSEEQEAAFGLVERDLADDLIEALTEELLSDRADARLASLSLHQLLVEEFPQTSDVHSGRILVAHILDVVLACFNPLSRGQDRVQDVLRARLRLHRRQLSLLLGG